MWEIYSYGGGDFLRMIFNGIASLFGNDSYIVALNAVALVGFVGWLFGIAMNGGKGFDLKHLLTIIMVLGLAVVPKKDLIITDRIVPANSAVVGNVPLGLALVASGFSKVGDFLTRSFETVFSLPNQVGYTGNGLLFASHLVEESTKFEFTDPRIGANMTDFWKSCVYYDLIFNKYTWKSMQESDDLIAFIENNTSSVRGFTYENAAGAKSIEVCSSGFSNKLIPDINAEIANATNIYGGRLVNTKELPAAQVARFSASLPPAYQYFTGLSRTNAEILGQNMMANSLRRGLSSFASEVDATAAAEDFAMAKAERERMMTFSVMGKLAKKMLPALQHLFEAFIYAIFPIVMMLMMLPVAGKVAMGYLQALLWINMWPPLYAILHFAMMYYSQSAASAAVVQSGGGFPTGLSVMTNTGLGQVLNDWAAIAGYLSMSIPMISYMVVSRSGAMAAGLAGKLLQGYESPVSKATDEAAAGNYNIGNTRYDTHAAFQSNTAPSMTAGGVTTSDGAGNTTRTSADGKTYVDIAASTGPVDIASGSSVASTAKQSLSEATQKQEQSSVSLAESNTALRAKVNAVASQTASQTTAGASTRTTEQVAYSQAKQNTERLVADWAKKNGISEQTVYSAAIEGRIGKSFGGKDSPLPFEASVQGKLGAEGRATSTDEWTKIQSFLSSDEYSKALRQEAAAASELGRSNQMSVQKTDMDGLNSALNSQLQAMNQKTLAVQDTENAQKAVEFANQVSASINAKGMDGFYSFLSQEKNIGIQQARMLVSDANAGDQDAKRELGRYTQEYIKSELAEYSQNYATKDALTTGNFASETQVFNGVNAEQTAIRNTDLNTVDRDNTGQVRGRNMADEAVVDMNNAAPSERQVLRTAEKNENEAQKVRDNPSVNMKPQTPSEKFAAEKEAMKKEVQTENDMNIVQRVVTGTENLASDAKAGIEKLAKKVMD